MIPKECKRLAEVDFFGRPSERALSVGGNTMANQSFDQVWRRVQEFEGQEFQTATGLTFSYSIKGNVLRPSRTRYNLSRSGFEKVWQLLPSATRSRLNKVVRGPSYVIAVLTDPRISPSASS